MTAPELTEQRTRRWLDALSRRDYDAVAELFDEHIALLMRLPLDGAREPVTFTGREQVLAYFHRAHELMPTTTVLDLRVSVTATGDTSFVQFNGDFTTADGRPYRNVYIWRADWRDGRMTALEEYANPVTFLQTFPDAV